MPRLAIIIPWWEAGAAFEDTLVSVLQNRPRQCEILVPHSRPYDDPYGIGDEGVHFQQLAGATELQLVNAGLRCASSPIIHVLGCGFEAEAGWADAALQPFADRRVSLVAPVVVERGKRQRVASAGLRFTLGGARQACAAGKCADRLESAIHDVVGPTLAAGFYRREDLLAVGGFDESLALVADIDVALTLRRLGQQCVVVKDSRVIGTREPWLAGGFCTGRQLERLYWRHADVRASSRLRHWSHVVGRLLAQVPSPPVFSEFCGRLVGMLEHRHYAEFRERLQQVPPLESGRSSHEPVSSVAASPLRRAA